MDDLMEKLVALCKRRGFLFQSSEIYGGLNGFWDYGPLGVELKRNIKDAWWRDMVTGHDDLVADSGAPGTHQMVGLDCSIIMNPKVWEASGHIGGFNDPMVDCRKCKSRFRADHLHVEWLKESERILGVACVLGTSENDPSTAASSVGSELSPTIKKQWKKHKDAKYDFTIYLMQSSLRKAGIENSDIPCPACHQKEALTEPRQFNLMFKTYVGALEDDSAVAYLRPETAQGIFANFKNVVDTARVKLPFGIAQIGKAFRNEINPRNFTFRSREFEQMEIEFFCRPDEAPTWYTFWRDRRLDWYVKLGLQSDRLHLREHDADELAHYAAACADVEYEFPFGVSELEGIANRTDFDLSQHAKFSGKDLSYFDDQAKERFVPYVIEPSAGADRATLAFLCEAYTEDAIPNEKGVPQPRTVMKFHPRLAPIKAAVFPLVNRDGMPELAEEIYRALRGQGLAVYFDSKGAIGRRYRRQDEAGTPFCITVDSQTLDDRTVTFRDRDTCEQWRVAMDDCPDEVQKRLAR